MHYPPPPAAAAVVVQNITPNLYCGSFGLTAQNSLSGGCYIPGPRKTTYETITPADLLRDIEEHAIAEARDTYNLQGESMAAQSVIAGIRRHEAEAALLEAMAAAQRCQSEIHHITLANLLSRVG